MGERVQCDPCGRMVSHVHFIPAKHGMPDTDACDRCMGYADKGECIITGEEAS